MSVKAAYSSVYVIPELVHAPVVGPVQPSASPLPFGHIGGFGPGAYVSTTKAPTKTKPSMA